MWRTTCCRKLCSSRDRRTLLHFGCTASEPFQPASDWLLASLSNVEGRRVTEPVSDTRAPCAEACGGNGQPCCRGNPSDACDFELKCFGDNMLGFEASSGVCERALLPPPFVTSPWTFRVWCLRGRMQLPAPVHNLSRCHMNNSASLQPVAGTASDAARLIFPHRGAIKATGASESAVPNRSRQTVWAAATVCLRPPWWPWP